MPGPFWDPSFSETPSRAKPAQISWLGSNQQDPYNTDLTAAVYWNQLNTGNPWDEIVIGGVKLPGIAVVHAQPTKRIQKLPQTGSTSVSHLVLGYDPGDIDILLRMWTPQQKSLFDNYMAILWPRPGKAPSTAAFQTPTGVGVPVPAQPAGLTDYFKAVWSIYHPALEHLGIKTCTVVSVSSLEAESSGVWNCKIKCWEWIKPNPTQSMAGRAKPESDRTVLTGAAPDPGATAANTTTPAPPSTQSRPAT